MAIVKLIEACGASGVKHIKVNDLEVEFYDGAISTGIPAYTGESIDFNDDVSDNETTVEDTALSDDITADSLEDLMLNDPLLYEESVIGIGNNDKDK